MFSALSKRFVLGDCEEGRPGLANLQRAQSFRLANAEPQSARSCKGSRKGAGIMDRGVTKLDMSAYIKINLSGCAM